MPPTINLVVVRPLYCPVFLAGLCFSSANHGIDGFIEENMICRFVLVLHLALPSTEYVRKSD